MSHSICERKSLEATTGYPSFREIWVEVALAVAALGLVFFGTALFFEIGALSGIPHASYCSYGTWIGAFLCAGGAVVSCLFKRYLSNTTDKNLTDPNEHLLTHKDQLEAEPFVGERTEQKSRCKWDYIQICLEHELQHADSPDNYIGPDDSEFSNLFLQCQDPEIVFISRKESRACSAFNITDQDNMELLTQKLQIAFLDGKKMAFAILDTGRHAIAAGFSSDGSFIIVDSLMSPSVDAKKIEWMLNEAKLKDLTQKEIHFNGRLINTHMQKGGHECLRFATLYCYHMAVCKDLTAFEEVNGAFLEGRLRRFEDYKKISGAPRIQSLKDRTCNYKTFMLSWLYRSFGLTVNAWWQLTLNELSQLQGKYDAEMMSCYLTKSCLPKFYSSSLEIVSSSLQRKRITAQTLDTLNLFVNPDLHTPMEDALFKENQSYLLVFMKSDPQPHLYSLGVGEKVEFAHQ